ncbi:ComF family protein [Pseudomonas syringae]|nr:ComF family protein [Pseudomonas syringae]MBD8576227.1 ComF family protein [Pseudomonas syringae]MBD8791859.1 ComF family protein [Pseudomonas syringae]MBD8802634.1 ComF family protein [Pseudomonas syringae]MBD8813206.1 ComF family protein [Pseudomonas syringae]
MPCQPCKDNQVYIWLKNRQFCLLCDEPSDTDLPLCVPCEAELPWLGAQCPGCALPLSGAERLCTGCRLRPPAFSQVIAPWEYRFVVDRLITRFKHQGQWPLGRLLADLMALYLQHRFDEGLPRPDALLPVPLARQRLRQRGFNQAAMLAGWLGKTLQIPVDERQLQRIRETPSQQGLDARARKHNLADAFSLRDRHAVRDRHLAVVDDVLTTGTTAQTLAHLLIQAGARRVDIYCLARTPAPQD